MTGLQAVHTAAEKVVSALAPKASTQAATGTTTGAKKDAAAESNITSTDFLSLLVSELKNQDPTQPTDPNAYVQQLVGVNSLQQLIQINQGISSLETSTSSTEVSLPSQF